MNELQKYQPNQGDVPLSVEQLVGQVNLIQKVMSAVMKENEHFGIIPGCGKKPSLLQPGAQKLLVTFRLAPEYQITEKPMDRGHREYVVQCTLKTIGSGSFVGQGAGSASTMEGKWRFRVAPKTLTDRPVPKAYWDLRQSDPKAAQESIGGKGFSTQKNEAGAWMIAEGTSEKVEHDNPADYYNTVLKMACKRALVAATLTATAASDIFTQDVEELVENMRVATAEAPAPAKVAPAATQPPAQRTFEQTVDGDEPPQEKPAPAPRAANTIKLGDVTTCEATLISFKEVHSKPDAPKPWTAWFCKFKDGQDAEFEAGTFDKKIGEKLDTIQGELVSLTYKPGKKAGTFEIITVEPADFITP
jgi:hypothetical protein